LPGLRQMAGTRPPQGFIRILRQFAFPFLEEGFCHILNGRNALVDGLRTGFAPLQLGTELIVLGFELPAAKIDDCPEALQGGLKLLLGGLLAVAGLLHAAHQEIPFGVAQLFHGSVVCCLTASQHQHGEHQQGAGTDTRVDRTTYQGPFLPQVSHGSWYQAFIPTVSLDVISLEASSGGYYRGHSEPRAAQ
jgi:hypothetical protein